MRHYTFDLFERVETEAQYEELESAFDMGGFAYADGRYNKDTGQVMFAVGVSEWGDVNGVSY